MDETEHGAENPERRRIAGRGLEHLRALLVGLFPGVAERAEDRPQIDRRRPVDHESHGPCQERVGPVRPRFRGRSRRASWRVSRSRRAARCSACSESGGVRNASRTSTRVRRNRANGKLSSSAASVPPNTTSAAAGCSSVRGSPPSRNCVAATTPIDQRQAEERHEPTKRRPPARHRAVTLRRARPAGGLGAIECGNHRRQRRRRRQRTGQGVQQPHALQILRCIDRQPDVAAAALRPGRSRPARRSARSRRMNGVTCSRSFASLVSAAARQQRGRRNRLDRGPVRQPVLDDVIGAGAAAQVERRAAARRGRPPGCRRWRARQSSRPRVVTTCDEARRGRRRPTRETRGCPGVGPPRPARRHRRASSSRE